MKKDKERLYYIGFYGDEQSYFEGRHIVPAGVNKMDYIAYAMSEAGLNVKIISPAWLKYDKIKGCKFIKQRKITVYENVNGILSPSFTLPFGVLKLLTILFAKLWLVFYIICNVRRHDKVVVYHSPFYFNCIYWLKRIIGFKLILEVEEIYSIVFSMSDKWRRKELKLIYEADNYIFPNDLMYSHLKIKDKKEVIVYGTYQLKDEKVISKYYNDNKIHLIYAGIIDKLKNGAFNAIRAAKYLPDGYLIHILGFGQPSDIKDLNNEIEIINQHSECKIIFEGKKTGDDYVGFVTGCHIGLSTQKNEGEYLEYTFPSKVLSYLSMGLRVVAADMNCLTRSKIDSLISYYESDTGESIARAIMRINDFNKEKPVMKIRELHSEFIANLKRLLG